MIDSLYLFKLYNMQNTSKTIVFIHGLFMNPKSWQPWMQYFMDLNYQCYAPAYPYHEGEPEQLRRLVDKDLGTLTLSTVVDEFVQFIDQLPEKPILVGHSMGGLIVQKLIAMDKAVAGVCIHSAPPNGMISKQWSFLKANLPVINPFKGDTVFYPTVDWFHYAFCNTMSKAQTHQVFDSLVVPESRNIPRSSTKAEGKIDFSLPHAPLLFIAGEKDHIVPAALNKKNFSAYQDPNSKTNFKLFPNRSHFVCGQENWQELADFIHNWITQL
jgi:pimeloyl-ACP methyl ester carboxylesterase